MPRQRVDTFLGVGFAVDDGTISTTEGEQDVKVLVIKDGGYTMRFPIVQESADKLADELRGSGLVTARTLHVPGTKPGR